MLPRGQFWPGRLISEKRSRKKNGGETLQGFPRVQIGRGGVVGSDGHTQSFALLRSGRGHRQPSGLGYEESLQVWDE